MHEFSQRFQKFFNVVDGQTQDEKTVALISAYARYQLSENQQAINRLEARYGMTFREFSEWLKQQPDEAQYRHDTERAHMEWEGFEDARRHWLQVLKEVTVSVPIFSFAGQSSSGL